MPRHRLHSSALLLGALLATAGCRSEPEPEFELIEATIPQMQRAMEDGRITSEELVRRYLLRIARYEPVLNAVISVNANAIAEAAALDRERASGRVRSPLHGIPIALKDNIQTAEMPTTGGALAFEGFVPPYESTVTHNLREAGAVIIAKTVMTELANWVAGPPTSMPANYSALGGFGMNPYDPRPNPWIGDGRGILSPGGSSSGIGTAANLWAANVGTETSGSILNPASMTMLAAIKPTVGRISRHGVIPITADQDTAGPMARSVTDAAIVLGVLEGASPDPNDPAAGVCAPPPGGDYTRYLDREGLQGARIGIPRAYFYEPLMVPGRRQPLGGLDPGSSSLMEDVIEVLDEQGAVLVDPVEIPSVVNPDPARNIALWNICVTGRDADENCSIVLKYGMKRDFNAWLRTLGESAPVRSLTELRRWNLDHAQSNSIRYGQSLLDISDEMDLEADRARYESDRGKDLRLTRTEGIDAAMENYDLDALLFPGSRSLGAVAGYPMVIVPAGMVPGVSSLGSGTGITSRPSPMGVNFTGPACSEPRLIELAYAFEQASRRRIPPPSAP